MFHVVAMLSPFPKASEEYIWMFHNRSMTTLYAYECMWPYDFNSHSAARIREISP